MGLGKTVILLALVLIHRAKNTPKPLLEEQIVPQDSASERDSIDSNKEACAVCKSAESEADDRFWIA